MNKVGTLQASFSIHGLNSPEEVAIAWRAVEQYRRTQPPPTSAHSDNQPSVSDVDGPTAALAARIYKGLTWRPLGPAYADIFRALLEAPETQEVRIEHLVSKLAVEVDVVKARLSKISGRMKRIATPEEIARVRTPFMLFADIEYDGTSSRYRLTPAGREAANRYLGR